MEKRIYKIPVGNLSREEAEKLIKEIHDKYSKNLDWREYEIRILKEKRIEKLNKLYDR
jgi:hypothetical protein